MKIDCHVHTKPYSPCSTLAPDELLKLIRDSEVDAVVLTEHETFWAEEHYRWLEKAFPDLKIFRGVETDVGSLGHVVVIPTEVRDEILTIGSPKKLVDFVEQTGSFAFVAHPFRYDNSFQGRNEDFALPGVEVASYNMHDREAVLNSLEFANKQGARPIAASDAHSPDPVGKYYLKLEAEVTSAAELSKVLKREDFKPVAPILEKVKEANYEK